MAVSSQNMMGSSLNDPVTRAVVDNIMGNLPTKKPLVKCEDCDLCFTSQTVLDAHLQGSRHAKQIRSKSIMATLEETKIVFTKDQEANGLKCNVCNVCLNSIQQLQTHLNGNRHKKKISKGGWTDAEVIEDNHPSPTSASNFNTHAISPTGQNKITVPLTCDVCNKMFNSTSQYDMHVLSRKHLFRTNSRSVFRNKKNKRYLPYKRKPRPEDYNRQIPSLSNNFVSGGYVN